MEKDGTWPTDFNFTIDNVFTFRGLKLTLSADFSAVDHMSHYGWAEMEKPEDELYGFDHRIQLHFPSLAVPKIRVSRQWNWNHDKGTGGYETRKRWEDDHEQFYVESDESYEDLYQKLLVKHIEYMKRSNEVGVIKAKKENSIAKEEAEKKAAEKAAKKATKEAKKNAKAK